MLQFAILFFVSCKFLASCRRLEDYAIEENDSWIFKSIAKCLSEVTELSTSGNQDVVVIFRETHDENANVLISTEYPVVVLREKILRRKLVHDRNGAVAYIFSNHSITEIINFISWDMDTKFVLVCSDKTQMKTDFTEFWEERIVNILALLYNHSAHDIYLFTFFPYRDGHCEKINRYELLSVWNPTSGVHIPAFPPKVSNFHKCPLNITMVERPPSIIEAQDGSILGVEVFILKLVAEAINATPIFQQLHKKKTKYKSNGNKLMLELVENHAHVVAGFLMMTYSVKSVSEGIPYYESICTTIAVPKIKNNPYLYIFTTLLAGTHFLFAIIMIFAFMLFFFICYKAKEKTITFTRVSWMLILPIIGGSRINIKYSISRVLFVSWLFIAFILGKVFEASISSSVLAPSQSKQMETINDVFESDFLFRGEHFLMQEVIPRYRPETHSAIINFTSIHETEAMEIISKQKNLAFLGSQINLVWTLLENMEYEENVYLQEKCLMTYSPVIQIRKNSPLYGVLMKYIIALHESGIIHEVFDLIVFNYFHKRDVQKMKTDFFPLNQKQISGAFVVLVFGLLLSCVCFVSELIYSRVKRKELLYLSKK